MLKKIKNILIYQQLDIYTCVDSTYMHLHKFNATLPNWGRLAIHKSFHNIGLDMEFGVT